MSRQSASPYSTSSSGASSTWASGLNSSGSDERGQTFTEPSVPVACHSSSVSFNIASRSLVQLHQVHVNPCYRTRSKAFPDWPNLFLKRFALGSAQKGTFIIHRERSVEMTALELTWPHPKCSGRDPPCPSCARAPQMCNLCVCVQMLRPMNQSACSENTKGMCSENYSMGASR